MTTLMGLMGLCGRCWLNVSQGVSEIIGNSCIKYTHICAWTAKVDEKVRRPMECLGRIWLQLSIFWCQPTVSYFWHLSMASQAPWRLRHGEYSAQAFDKMYQKSLKRRWCQTDRWGWGWEEDTCFRPNSRSMGRELKLGGRCQARSCILWCRDIQRCDGGVCCCWRSTTAVLEQGKKAKVGRIEENWLIQWEQWWQESSGGHLSARGKRI